MFANLVYICIASVIDPHLLARLQAMVDTLVQTRALQEQLNQARGDHRQQSTRSNGSFSAEVDVVETFDANEVSFFMNPLFFPHPLSATFRSTYR